MYIIFRAIIVLLIHIRHFKLAYQHICLLLKLGLSQKILLIYLACNNLDLPCPKYKDSFAKSAVRAQSRPRSNRTKFRCGYKSYAHTPLDQGGAEGTWKRWQRGSLFHWHKYGCKKTFGQPM